MHKTHRDKNHQDWLESLSAEMLRAIESAITKPPVPVRHDWDYHVEAAVRCAREAHYRFGKLSQRTIRSMVVAQGENA